MSAALEPVIGLEVHAQLSTASKIFCGCATAFGAPPNTQICPVCTGQPGVLPVLNHQAVALAVRVALALGCTVHHQSRFARKSYFYPDLPKGYQITQADAPLAEGGAVELILDGQRRAVPLTRIHLEEDAGKSLHPPGAPVTQVDLNRAGVPLIEIVSAPAISSPAEAAEAMRSLRAILRALGASDGNLEQGSLRCDANISLRPAGSAALGVKVEVKNLNSFKFVQRALEHEIARQKALYARGEPVVAETRLWDSAAGVTASLRSKEEAHDYRYFPEPDLPPLELDARWLAELDARLPELPLFRRRRLSDTLGLPDAMAADLTREAPLADYFEQTVAAGAAPRAAATWLLTELLSRLDDARAAARAPVTPARTAELLALVADGTLSGKLAKGVWQTMWETGRGAAAIVQEAGLAQQSDTTALEAVVETVIAEHPQQAARFRAGKAQLLGYFVGQVMKATAGRANPKLVNELLRRHLEGTDQ